MLHDAFEGAKDYKPKKVRWLAPSTFLTHSYRSCCLQCRTVRLTASGGVPGTRSKGGCAAMGLREPLHRGIPLQPAKAPANIHHSSLTPWPMLQSDWLSSYWAGFMSPSQHSRIRNTGVPMDLLRVGRAGLDSGQEGFGGFQLRLQGSCGMPRPAQGGCCWLLLPASLHTRRQTRATRPSSRSALSLTSATTKNAVLPAGVGLPCFDLCRTSNE